MNFSQNGLSFLKRHEGCVLDAYLDSVGTWTIGYGHTNGVKQGQKISLGLAEAYLKTDIAPIEHFLENEPYSLNQNQFDALVSFVFNVGLGAFHDSTMRKCLLSRDYLAAAEQFDRWHIPPEIICRRNDEKKLFLTP